MRVKIKKHNSFRSNYDYCEVIEAKKINKEIQFDKCWLCVDNYAFEMVEEEADRLVEIVFSEGKLDLTGYKITSIPL